MIQNTELFADEGILTSWVDHPDELKDRPELDEREPVVPRLVKLFELVSQGFEDSAKVVRRHRKAAAAVGGTMLGGIGFAAGAKVFSHRPAH